MPVDSRNIPEPIKREVRQRCGFGCVICGLPLYEYEHLLGWANVKRHVANEITLLCDIHHREKTSGLLPLEDVREADRDPFNRQAAACSPYLLHYRGPRLTVSLGTTTFTSAMGGTWVAVSVDGIPLISFTLEDGRILLSVVAFDHLNNEVLRISDNQLIYSTTPWDIQFVGKNLTIREGRGQFLLERFSHDGIGVSAVGDEVARVLRCNSSQGLPDRREQFIDLPSGL